MYAYYGGRRRRDIRYSDVIVVSDVITWESALWPLVLKTCLINKLVSYQGLRYEQVDCVLYNGWSYPIILLLQKTNIGRCRTKTLLCGQRAGMWGKKSVILRKDKKFYWSSIFFRRLSNGSWQILLVPYSCECNVGDILFGSTDHTKVVITDSM